MGEMPTITIVDPFDAFNEVGCANARVADALAVIGEMLHDAGSGEIDESHLQRHVYQAWNLLEMTREYLERSRATFHAAENDLYSRGIPRQVQQGRAA